MDQNSTGSEGTSRSSILKHTMFVKMYGHSYSFTYRSTIHKGLVCMFFARSAHAVLISVLWQQGSLATRIHWHSGEDFPIHLECVHGEIGGCGGLRRQVGCSQPSMSAPTPRVPKSYVPIGIRLCCLWSKVYKEYPMPELFLGEGHVDST